MYGDALVSTAIIMFILPVILSVFWMATLTIYKAYYWDHIVQDTVMTIFNHSSERTTLIYIGDKQVTFKKGFITLNLS